MENKVINLSEVSIGLFPDAYRIPMVGFTQEDSAFLDEQPMIPNLTPL